MGTPFHGPDPSIRPQALCGSAVPGKRLQPGNHPGGTLPHTSSSPHPEDSVPVPAAPSDPAASSAGPAAPHHRRPARTDTSPRPWENEKFLAAAKSSCHGKSKILAPHSLAAAFVPSVDPVSVTRISSGNPATLSRHRPSTSSSFLRSCKDSRRPQPRPAFTRFYCQYMSRAKTVECFPKKTYNKTMKTTPEPESSGPQGGT